MTICVTVNENESGHGVDLFMALEKSNMPKDCKNPGVIKTYAIPKDFVGAMVQKYYEEATLR